MKQLRHKTAKSTTFLPVKVVEDRAPTHQADPAMVEIVVDRRVVRVGRGFDPMLLRAVLVALEAEPC